MCSPEILNIILYPGYSLTAVFRHWGGLGLLIVGVLDSSSLPTFAGTDVLTAILAGTHGDPWYAYAIVATVGSTIGAYLTFSVARKAGSAHFEKKGLSPQFEIFRTWGMSVLAASTAVPFPFPTSLLFAAAGASGYNALKFVTVVAACRAIRYFAIAIIVEFYSRNLVYAFHHPAQYWGWLLASSTAVFGFVIVGILLNRRLASVTNA